MRVITSTAEIREGMSDLAGVSAPASSLPVLACVLLVSTTEGGGQLSAVTTDLDVTLRVTKPAQVPEPGRALVDAKLLAGVLKSVGDGQCELHTADGGAGGQRLVVDCTDGSFSLAVRSPDEFPTCPQASHGGAKRVPGLPLARAIDRVLSVAMAAKEFIGAKVMRVDFTTSGLSAVSTDGRRLAAAYEKFSSEYVDSVLLSTAAAQALSSMAARGGERLLVNRSEGGQHVSFSQPAAGVELLVREANVKFPTFEGAIPTAALVGPTLRVPKDQLRAVLSRVGVLAGAKLRACRLEWRGAVRALAVGVANPDLGAASSQVSATPMNGCPDEGRVALNVRYLLDAVEDIGDVQDVELAWNEKIVTVRPLVEDGWPSTAVTVLAPMME